MIGPMNTTVSILRGEAVDEYLDDTDPPQVRYSRIPVSILEVSASPTTRAQGRPQSVRAYQLRTTADVDLREDDRVRDESDSAVYVVTQVTAVRNPVFGGHVKASLTRNN